MSRGKEFYSLLLPPGSPIQVSVDGLAGRLYEGVGLLIGESELTGVCLAV